MNKIASILNEILGAGCQRRKDSTPRVRVQTGHIWEVRPKHADQPTQDASE